MSHPGDAAGSESSESLVSTYLDHLEDGEHVRRIFADRAAAVRVLGSMLGSGERERVQHAALVLRDALLYRFVPGVWELIPRSGLLAVLEANLHATDYAIRRTGVYTLGKLTYPRMAPALARAFPAYLERHPLEVPTLLSELFWLSARERRRRWEYLDAVARAPHYLTRWSVFEAAGHGWVDTARGSVDAKRYRRLLERLARDDHAYVRREASTRLANARARREGKRWDGAQEVIGGGSFGTLAIRFGNYLWASGRADYDLALIDRFARFVHAAAFRRHDGQTPDPESLARAFEEWDGAPR